MSRSLAAVLIALAALAGCASRAEPTGPQTISIKGALTFTARIALPPETRAVVELKDASAADGRVVAEQRIQLAGQQVPIPFELTVDRAKLVAGRPYVVRGALFVQDRARWVSDTVMITPNTGVIDVGMLDMKPYTAQAFAADLECGDRKVTVGFVGNVMRLTTGDRAFDMHPVTSASGAKYEAVGDPSTTLWNKGDETIIVIKGQTYPPCVKSSGKAAPFRATGNEPGWRLDIGETEMTFLASDGKRRVVTPTLAAGKSEGVRRYVAKSGGSDLTVTVFAQPCADTMTGMPHPSTVVVLFEGKTLNGCGGDPAALLRGGEWVVEDITGVRLVDGSRITLAFGADGRVSGMASCNRYGAEYALTGEGLTISKGFTTRMACDPPLMQQEQVFLETLNKVDRFEMGPDGTLLLHTSDRRTITARRG